ncbi:MAG: AAA family ATPase [Tissierellia bacterium]|nr:AAA family ATPase [Tissierellia bacterium]
MRFIAKIILENFQSHEYTEINLDKGLNVILGNSDSGKTAIIRAIRWVLYNEPRGDFFMQYGKDSVSVTLEFQDGLSLKRYRNKGTNGYVLIDPSGEDYTFENFGTEVPVEIRNLLHMNKMPLGNKTNITLNISDQMDGPFLLMETDSLKANAIGRLVGVHIIDEAASNVNRDLKNHQRRIKSLREEKDRLIVEEQELSYLDHEVKKIKASKENIFILKKKISLLKELKNKKDILEKISETSKRLNHQLKCLEYTNELEKRLNTIETHLLEFNRRSIYYNRVTYLKNEKKIWKNHYQKYKNLPILKSNYIMLKDYNYTLSKLIHQNKLYHEVIHQKQRIQEDLRRLKDLGIISDRLYILESKIKQLQNYLEYYHRYHELIRRIQLGYQYLEKFQVLEQLNKNYTLLSKAMKNLISYKKEMETWLFINKQRKDLQLNINMAEKSKQKYLDLYEQLLSTLKICPTCLQPIHEGTKEHLKEHFK